MNKNTKNKFSNLDNLSLEVYNDSAFANSYSNKIEYNSHNAFYERPAMLSLLPDVNDLKILDAGCGPGKYAEILIDKGARVTGIDFSDEMLKIAEERTTGKAKLIKANLNYPLPLDDQAFDIVLSSLVLHYIKDWQQLFSEFNRVLKPGGYFIFSTDHPAAVCFRELTNNYFETELLKERWGGYGIEMTSFRRPLSDVFKTLKSCDFLLDEFLEPIPSDECKISFPDAYEELMKFPSFVCFRAIKTG